MAGRSLQARGRWFEPSCAHQVRSLFRNTALVAKSKRRAKRLTAGDVPETLDALAVRLSTSSLQIVRNCLERAIRHAEVRDLVGRNVAALVKAPAGRAGRPSKSLTLEQAQELLRVAGGSRLCAYVVLSVTTGLRTEELRAWGPVGQTPVVVKTGERKSISMVSAISPRGEMRFRVQEGTMNADRFIDFLKALLSSVEGRIFLIVDGHPAHRAAKVKEFTGNETGGRLKIYSSFRRTHLI